MWRFVETLFLVAGITGVGIWAGSYAARAIYQRRENHILDRSAPAKPSAFDASSRAGGTEKKFLADGSLLGRLVIPRLHVQSIVREGTGETTLDLSLGHIPGTAFPGENGNVGVAGHRDTLFRGLRAIGKDDRIVFQTPRNSYVYKVESTQIVRPQDVSVLRASQNPELTLVTCYPFSYVGSAPDRFIVKAQLVSQEPRKVTRSTSWRPDVALDVHR